MISFRPSSQALRQALRRALGAPSIDAFEASAVERWTIAPPTRRVVPAAHFLAGQLDKILDTEFSSVEVLVDVFKGGFECVEEATEGLRFRQVDLVDGVLYADGGSRHLRARQRRLPAYRRPERVLSGAMYETWNGNRWFGSWLLEDCLTHELAMQHGATVTTAPRPTRGHAPQYERALGIDPVRVSDARFEELVLYRDGSQNDSKKARAIRFRDKLLAGREPGAHAGVFLLRGGGGDRRILVNERAVAERLAARRGFKVIDPLELSLDEIVEACAGARVVAGIEGSHLVHGLMTMPARATLLVIQPPYRVVSTLKATTDRQGQGYAFVVGDGGREDFSVDIDDVERTLDLLPA